MKSIRPLLSFYRFYSCFHATTTTTIIIIITCFLSRPSQSLLRPLSLWASPLTRRGGTTIAPSWPAANRMHKKSTGGGTTAAASNHAHSATTSDATSPESDAASPSSSSSWNKAALREACLTRCILPLSPHTSYKGSSGRLAVLGGSALYTGAPYYAGMAALQTGADLVTIFTAQQAATPLKAYSPELMVQAVYDAPTLNEAVATIQGNMTANQDELLTVDGVAECLTRHATVRQAVDDMIQTACDTLPRYHAWIVGPGLGRCPLVGYAVGCILQRIRAEQPDVPIVLDADALWFLGQSPRHWQDGIVRDNAQIILTPNRMEYQRLIKGQHHSDETPDDGPTWARAATVLQKGAQDVVGVGLVPAAPPTQGDDDHGQRYVCSEPGGRKRSGGIGDILAGTTATLAAWQSLLRQRQSQQREDDPPHWIPAAWTASHLVKRATHDAWIAKKRAMTAPDVLNQLGLAYEDMIGSDYGLSTPLAPTK